MAARRVIAVEASACLATVIIQATKEEQRGAFGAALGRWLGLHVAFDHCVVFGYRGTARPWLLFETFSPADSHVFVSLYQEGPYLLDPFHHAAIEGREGFWRMRELAPDRFFASEYYRSYYSQTQLAEEVGFFVPLPSGASIVLSLMRSRGSGPFGAAEIRRLRAIAPVVIALARMRWERASGPPRSRDQASGRD